MAELKLRGVRIDQVDPSERGLAMVFQSYALYLHMTVADATPDTTPLHSPIAMQVDPVHCHLFAADGRAMAPLGKTAPRDIVAHMKVAGGIAASGHSYC
jgi:ABC-type Fe3+/spermidine/putrescine transport system ATPase subunit